MNMTPTIKDVAKKANVSIATVSRILNNLPGYSETTKKKVLQAIEELGYHPNAIARGLINKRTQTIGVLFPNVSNMYSSAILDGIEQTAHHLDHSVIVCNTDSNGKRTKKYLQVLKEKQVDGVIFTSEVMNKEYYDMLLQMNIPIVLVSTVSYQYPLPYVKVDDKHAAYTATEYLIKNGHHKIAMISGPKGDPIAGGPRVDGFMQALEDNRVSKADTLVLYGDGFGFKEGEENLPIIIEKNPDITAVFTASDEIAAGALSIAYKMGIKVPDELSVVGFDNTMIAEMSIPPLTTVAQPLFDMGRTASEMLFSMIRNKTKTIDSRIMPHQIIERKSVKRLN
ncbi:MAG TPA: LacI family DNA-binding transcriptional regulator [Bacillales bacterium]|nr:LacI family DNA-binding transcriptional regulator [Bacillales bacterium]